MAKVLLELLIVFLLVAFASSGSVAISDGYGQVEGVNIRSSYVYWISCKGSIRDSPPMPCRVLRKSVNDNHEEKFCDLEFEGRAIKNLEPLSKDLVALSWYASYKGNYRLATTVINIENCNKVEAMTNGTVYLFDLLNAHLRLTTTFATANGEYRTLFYSPEACNAKFCELTFDVEGKNVKISNFFKNALEKFQLIHNIKPLDVEKESYLVDQIWKFYLLKPSGLKLLTSYDLYTKHGESIAHGTIRFCQNSTIKLDEINCTVFDANGEMVSNINVNLNHVFDDIMIENLPNGQFLLFTKSKSLNHTYVTKIGADGKLVGTFVSNGQPECKTVCINKRYLEIIDNKYCISVLRLSILVGFSYGRQCFSDDDFIKVNLLK